MTKIIEWLAMGGYAVYVWPAYVLVALMLAVGGITMTIQKRRMQKKLMQWFNKG